MKKKVSSLEKDLEVKQMTIDRLRKITNIKKSEGDQSFESKRLLRFGTR